MANCTTASSTPRTGWSTADPTDPTNPSRRWPGWVERIGLRDNKHHPQDPPALRRDLATAARRSDIPTASRPVGPDLLRSGQPISTRLRRPLGLPYSPPRDLTPRIEGPPLPVIPAGSATRDTHAVALIGHLPADEVDIVFALAATSPVPVLEMQRVDDRHWWSLTCTQDCCPPGQPISSDSPVDVALIAASGSPAPTRDSLTAQLKPGPDKLVDDDAARVSSLRGGRACLDSLGSALTPAHASTCHPPPRMTGLFCVWTPS